jgi:hypothetical protein
MHLKHLPFVYFIVKAAGNMKIVVSSGVIVLLPFLLIGHAYRAAVVGVMEKRVNEIRYAENMESEQVLERIKNAVPVAVNRAKEKAMQRDFGGAFAPRQ